MCNHQTSQGAEWRLTHVTDCLQATTPTLPPDRWLTHSLPGLRDNEEEVEEEYSASASSGPVSARIGSHWCNHSEQQVSGQTAAATGGAGLESCHGTASCQPLAPGKFVLNFPFSHQVPLQHTGETVSWMYLHRLLEKIHEN